MALRSMTGFGDGAAVFGEVRVTAELSSVNRKQLDINVSLPRNLAVLESRMQKLVRAAFSRGRISGTIRVEGGSAAGAVKVDEGLAADYVKQVREVAERLELLDNLGADTLLRISGLVSVEQVAVDTDSVAGAMEEALAQALKGMAAMRESEGKALQDDLLQRITLLEQMVVEIEELAPNVVVQHREKMFARLEEAGLEDIAEDERIVREVALFADRSDITEELTRLKSHIAQGRELLGSTEPVGRTLDFLCQEFFREINTTGSKSNNLEITRLVVAFKTELERIREQVQNVE